MTDVATKSWYIVHTYSGFEKKVAESLQERVKAYGLQSDIGEVLIPTEDVVELAPPRRLENADADRLPEPVADARAQAAEGQQHHNRGERSDGRAVRSARYKHARVGA